MIFRPHHQGARPLFMDDQEQQKGGYDQTTSYYVMMYPTGRGTAMHTHSTHTQSMSESTTYHTARTLLWGGPPLSPHLLTSQNGP
jgi:hypothetical protein